MTETSFQNSTNEPRLPYLWRSKLISFCLLLGWGVMIVRLIHLQGAQRVLLNDRVTRQSSFTDIVPARPGEILDRNGHVLAMTITRESLYCVPARIDDPTEFVWQLSRVLNLNADDLHRRIIANSKKHFIWVKRRVSDDQVARIRRLDLPDRAWGFRREYLRQYPQGQHAAHVLGMRDIDNKGHGGLEQSLDDLIRGVDGNRVMTRDARGIVVEVEGRRSKSPVQGRTVVCSLDIQTQIFAERLLAKLVDRWTPLGASAIVMEPHSGEVLAMASVPTFDPNNPGKSPKCLEKPGSLGSLRTRFPRSSRSSSAGQCSIRNWRSMK